MEYGSPPQPYAGTLPFLDLTGASSSLIKHLRIAYADTGVTTPAGAARLDVWDCQFIQCLDGVNNDVGAFGGVTTLHNVLFAGCDVAVRAGTNNIEIEAEHVTADVTQFWSAEVAPWKIKMVNSLITGALGSTPISDLENVVTGVTSNAFATVNTGNYYLASASSHRQTGTTNITPSLQALLAGKTTTARCRCHPSCA